MKKHPPPISIVRARQLRRSPTKAETVMWRLLREQFTYARFRRQVPLRHFFCDFASHRFKLVIELDGGQHGGPDDLQRTGLIEAEGYRVVRFWNNEVLKNAQGCSLRLETLLAPDQHPLPASTRQPAAKSAHPSPIEGEG